MILPQKWFWRGRRCRRAERSGRGRKEVKKEKKKCGGRLVSFQVRHGIIHCGVDGAVVDYWLARTEVVEVVRK